MDNNPDTPQNNPQTPNPVVFPQATPQPPSQPEGPFDRFKNNLHKHKLTVAFALGLVLLVIGGILLTRTDERANNLPEDGGKSAVVYKDWLSPTSEIKVGDNRYVSTCQVLPVSAVVESVYDGKPPVTFAVGEEYYDSSPAVQQFSRPLTRCVYGDAASLSAEQYYDAADVKRLSSTVTSSGEEYLEDKVAAYKRAAESAKDETLSNFVSQIDSSTRTYLEKREAYSRKDTESLDTSTLIIPTGNYAVGFTVFANNVVYNLELPSKVRISDMANAPNDQLVTQLSQAKEMVDELRKNSKNARLSQSPAPTILSDKPQVGQTYILEPCAILTRDIIKTVTGLDQANVIERASTIYGINEKRTSQSGVTILPSNDCTRAVRPGEEVGSGKTQIKLDIEYSPDAATLDKKLKDTKYLPLEGNNTQIQTNADFAAEYVVGSFNPFYQFRIGNYWAYLKITTLDTRGTEVKVSRDQHITAINLLVDSLKSNLEQAEATKGR